MRFARIILSTGLSVQFYASGSDMVIFLALMVEVCFLLFRAQYLFDLGPDQLRSGPFRHLVTLN